MENRTNFNLNDSIDIWKSKLSKNSTMTVDNIDELESHLQDEIQELEQLGLSTEESFLIAKKRIGNVKNLTAEYEKVNKSYYFKNSIIPYIKGILMFVAFKTMTGLLINLTTLVAIKFNINKNLNSISIIIPIVATLILVALMYRKYKNSDWIFRKLTGIPVLVSFIFVGKLINYFSSLSVFYTIEPAEYSFLKINLNYYNSILGLFFLIFSCIIFYSLKKESRGEIAD